MPIRLDPGSGPGQHLRWFYSIDWPQISCLVCFEKAGGACEQCGRPHGKVVFCPTGAGSIPGARVGATAAGVGPKDRIAQR